MGHASVATTGNYVRKDEENLRKAAEKAELQKISIGTSAKYVIFSKRPPETEFSKNPVGISYPRGVDLVLQRDITIFCERKLIPDFKTISSKHIGD